MKPWLRRAARPLLFAAGVLLGVGTLVGSRFLAPGAGGADAPPADAPKGKLLDPAAPAKYGSGPVVLGFVDTDPPVVGYGLPPNMQTGLVAKLFVHEGQTVADGAELFAFDSTVQEATYKRALAAVEVARKDAGVAQQAVGDHQSKIALARQAVEAARTKETLTAESLRVSETAYRQSYVGESPEKVAQRLADEPKLLELRTTKLTAEQERKLKEAELNSLTTSGVPAAMAAKAEAGVLQAEATAGEAKAALDLCVVRARVPGIVEQINVSPGMTVGISSRTTALWFVPAGPRIVRAEVEPDFAQKVTLDPGQKERPVTVYDNTDSKLTYQGVLKRVGTSFLKSRNATDGLMSSESRVLECVIEVADWAPVSVPPKPPLRVGQKVRVNFGQ